MTATAAACSSSDTGERPRLGFAGVGWIGRDRLRAVVGSGAAEIAAIADPEPALARSASELAPQAVLAPDLDALLEQDLDGVVIATPSAMHSAQAQRALRAGFAVFCQKPLSRTAAEANAVLGAARDADRLLAVDFSYRCIAGVPEMREAILSGEIGDVFAVDLTFHNAYGPDKPWFRDAGLSGGGCMIDLGSHLADLSLWMMDWPPFGAVRSRLYAKGRPVDQVEQDLVEDCAFADWFVGEGTGVRLACSWNVSAGQDAVIEAAFYGTRGSYVLRNLSGSFYDFAVEHCVGTTRRRIAGPPDAWTGRAIVAWVERLSRCASFDSDAGHLLETARLVDAVYRR